MTIMGVKIVSKLQGDSQGLRLTVHSKLNIQHSDQKELRLYIPLFKPTRNITHLS